VIAKLLPEAQTAGIPLANIYVAAYGRHWVSKMYEAQSKLKTEIEGWYFHPYGPPSGTAEENGQGIQSLPNVQAEMTSGQNNIIVSEIGYWTHDVNGGESKGGPSSVWAENSTQAAQWLTETLDNALPYRQAGWLKALLIYSRNDGGWAMELPGSTLTKQGEALDNFANVYGAAVWSVQSTPNPNKIKGNYLRGISCLSSSACTATGYYVNSSGATVTLAEGWDGTEWTAQTTPNESGTYSELSSVSCTAAKECTAVGLYKNGSGTPQPLVERLGGTGWAIQATPKIWTPMGLPAVARLSGVSCVSATACIAVGSYENSSGVMVTLAESWNGTEWTIQTTPNETGASYSELSSVSCTAAKECTAVGLYKNGSGTLQPLVERLSGTGWVIQATPKIWTPMGLPAVARLSGVSCVSATACIAVGSYENSSGVMVTLAESWNGTEWTIQTTPNPSGSKAGSLYGISCLSSTACTATGRYINSSGTEATLAEVWNGTPWLLQITPNPNGATASVLNGVSCTSTILCTAVGSSINSSGIAMTLAEDYR
jgi:hypothetical protein